MTVRSRSLDRAAAERRLRKRRGRVPEAFGAGVLIAKGYRILGRRVRTRAGEIDIVAVRGKRLAFVEVKQRLTREDAESAVSRAARATAGTSSPST
jgi:putative endonuclease